MKRTVVKYQVIAGSCLLLALIAALLGRAGYDVLIFHTLILRGAVLLLPLISLILEFVLFCKLYRNSKRARWIVLNLLLAPVILGLLINLVVIEGLGMLSYQGHTRYSYEDFDQDIVIYNSQVLLGGASNVYETKNGVILKHVATVQGDDGWMPLCKDTDFVATVSENGILFSYGFTSAVSDANDPSAKSLYLAYKNGHFTKAYSNP